MGIINAIKEAIAAPFVGLSFEVGWFGWLVAVFGACLAGDWITGSAAAAKNGEWSSKISREGIWHKAGCIVVVLVAAVLDRVIGGVLNNIPGISPPFTYTVLLCPIILVWYILTELGSIIENAGKMGAPVPGFLKKAIALIKGTVDAAGDKITQRK
ncbi:holin family protein [Ruminiclostridium hungatei]|uniref:Holin family protein n=1 Tax=Ruminiclostridium hungatei TaxID=48256 RepID=A0A1V4SK75_RUMHU|nr:phage holin family protein [Ruminiclostridium hungatei]OPX43845.1 holin family protein [Ruminiclostridium hungatei]